MKRSKGGKIIVSSINFHPDHSGIALYSTDLPVYFAQKGAEVTMVTGFPYYPKWKKNDADRGRLFGNEVFKKVKTLRGYLYVPGRVTTAKRILHELSFLFFACINFLRAGRHDCIVIISPPLLLGVVGVLFKKVWGAKLVFHIQDLQPDAALALGMVRESLLIKILKKAEKFIYRNSDIVATITDGMFERLLDKGVPKEKLAIYYNWIDMEEATRPAPKGGFIGMFPHLRGKFIVAYAGNIGMKQGVEVLVELAEATAENDNIHYFIIGEGADKERLVGMASKKNLRNLTFLDFLDQKAYFEMLEDIDVSFVAQRGGSGNVFFPSKLLGIMAKSKPLLISADTDSELSTVIERGGCGLVAPAGDIENLKTHIEYMAANRKELERMGRNGFKLVKEYGRDRVLSAFLERITSIL